MSNNKNQNVYAQNDAYMAAARARAAAAYESDVRQSAQKYGFDPSGETPNVNQWFESAYNAIEEMNSYNKENWDVFDTNYGGEAGTRVSKLLGEAVSIGDYLRRNQGSDYAAWNQALAQYRHVLSGLNNQNKQRSEFFRQWNNESEYNWTKKYEGQSAAEMRSAAEGLEDGDEKTWLTNYADYTDYTGKMNYDVPGAQQELEQLQNQRRDMQAKHHKLEQYRHSPLLMLTDGDTYRQLEQEVKAFTDAGGMEGLEKQIAQKSETMRSAKQLQDTVRQQQEHEQWLTTIRKPGEIAGQVEQMKAQTDKLRAELQIYQQTYKGFMDQPMLALTNPQTFGDLERGMRDKRNQYQAALQQLEALEKEYWWGRNQEYAALAKNSDFQEKSRYVSTETENANWDRLRGGYLSTGFADVEYDYINRNPVAIGRQNLIAQQDGSAMAGTDQSARLEMTDEEIKTYNYLYATQGREAAKDYVNFLGSDLNKRQRAQYEAFAQQMAASGKLGAAAASAMSVGMAPVKGIAYLGQAADYLTDGRIDQNAGYNKYAYTSKAIRDTVAQQVQNNPKWGKAGAFGYQLVMSMGDFLISAGISGGSSAVASAIMGTGAAADTVIDAKDRGLSDSQAFTLGTVAGLAETLTEKYSLETLLDADLLKDSVGRYVVKNMLAEGSEEAASSLINLFTDIIVSQDKSAWMQSIRQYQEAGYTKGEAFGKVLAEQAAAIGLDALGGAISGGVMGGGSALNYSLQTSDTGQAMRAMGMDDATAKQFVDTGLKAAPDSASYQVAAQMQAKLNKGKTLTAEDKGRLAQANPQMAQSVIRQGSGSVRLATPQVNVSNADPRWQQGQRLAGITGKNVVFYNGSETENGYYDRNTGEIYINANGKDTAVQVFSHELTHSAEMADAYRDLQKACFQKLRSLRKDITQLRQEKLDQYREQGHPLNSNEEADQEIVAEFVSNYLLTDEVTIAEVVLDSPSLGRRILHWIDGVLARLGNENAQERVFLQNTRQIYTRALEQTRSRPWLGKEAAPSGETTAAQPQTEAQSRYDQELENSIAEMTEAYENGELDEDTYNAIVENLRQGTEERKASGRQYSFAGERARTADLDALSRAKEMQAQGVANETIRQETGWFQGMDGKWRWEIDDSGMKYHRAGDARFSQMHEDYARHQELTGRFIQGDLSQQEVDELQALDEIWGREHGRLDRRVKEGNATLHHIIQHDALFDAYPDLRNVKVRFDVLNRNTLGQYYPNANLIILSNSLQNAPQDTILHEVQHAIQRAEGFASGSNKTYWDERQTAGDTPETRGMTEAKRRWEAFEQDPENAEAMVLMQQMSDAEESGDAYTYAALEQEAEQRGLADKIRQYEELEYAYYTQESRAFNMVPSELYRNTAGEIEARNVSDRRNMDLEARKKSPPDLGDERTVFAQSAQSYAAEEDHIKDQIRDNLNELNRMDPVVSITIPQWLRSSNKDTKQNWAIAQLKYTNYKVVREGRGEILFPEKRLRAGFNYLRKGAAEDFLFEALPDVLKHGIELKDKDVHKGRQYGTFTIGAPILVNGKRGNLAVVVKKTTNNFYKVHRILSPDGSMFILPETTEEAGPTSGGGVTNSGSLATPISSASKFSLSQKNSDVNKQYTTTRENLNRTASDYLKKVENRLVRQIGNQLNIPRYAQWDQLRPVVQEMVDEFLQTGTISDEAMEKAFSTAYDEGKAVEREFYDQYKPIKDHLRATAVTISDRDKADIPDFNQWRQGVFGTLRIVNEGGLPVDTAYQELGEMAPELFPERITHPADQLMKMGEVAKRIRITERSLNEYYGPEAGEFRKWAKHEFGCAVGDIMPQLRNVKRYAEQEQAEAARPALKNEQEAQQAFRVRKRANVEKERARAKHLLSAQDNRYVKGLMDGTLTLEDLKGKDCNLQGIQEVYEASREYEEIDRQIRRYQAELRQRRQEEADKHLGSSLYWKDKKNGFSYKRETMRRNILDIVRNRSDALALLRDYFEPVQIAEAERQRFLTQWRNKVRELNLSTTPIRGDEVSEAYAVQLYGEAITSIEMIQQSRGRIKERDGRSLQDWQGLIADTFNRSPGIDRGKIENAVKVYRQMYDELFRMMNEVLVRNGYPPVEYRKGYFPHFQGQDDGVMAKFGRLLGINIMDDVLPTTINGLTHKFRPGKQWFAHAQERTGFQTTYDAVEGFDRYIEGVSNVIFHTDNIQNLRALATQIRYRASDAGIREQARAIQENENLSDYEKEKRLEELYEGGKFALSNFVRELDEYTNILAGKKSMADRSAEHWFSRKYYTWIKTLESQVGANMVGGNLTSALTNFIPLTQAWGQLDTTNLLCGMRDALMAMKKSDGFADQSDFLTSRRGSERLVQTWVQKASGVAGLPMELIDNFTSEAITRGAYYQNLKRGMSQQEALHQADIFAAGVMGDRSKGAMPTLFEMKNPVAKIFTQFQLEVNNQLSEVFKDLPRAAREKRGREIAAMVLKYFMGAWMFNELYEWLIGRRPALDPINMAWEAVEDWQDDGLFEAGQNLANNVIETLPFIGGVIGGGRVPISSALPDMGNVWGALTEDPYDEETGEGIAMRKRLSVLGTELSKPAMLLAFPFAGNQVMKSWKGIKTLIEGGSYTIDNAGNKHLQYAVHMDDPWTIFRNSLLASVMGKSALPEAREWTAGGFGSFTAAQTEIYQDLLNSGAGSREAYQLIDDLRSAQKTETESRAAVQRKLLDEYGMPDEARAIVYYGMLADEKERALMDKLTDLGATSEEAGNVVRKLWDAEQLKADQKKTAQAEVLGGSNLTDEEKREVVATLMETTNLVNEKGYPTEYAKFLTAADAGLSVDSYMNMRAKGVYMDDFFEFTDTGVPCEMAADITMKMKDLKPNAGYSSVSYLQRAQVVLDADMTENQKLAALAAVSGLYDSTYAKIELGYYMGMGLQSYVDLRKAMPKYDANGNGSYTAKETRAAIDGALGSLSNAEKAILWQLQNKSWKPKNNPYDREVGQRVYDAMQNGSEEEFGEADPYALMRALSIIE